MGTSINDIKPSKEAEATAKLMAKVFEESKVAILERLKEISADGEMVSIMDVKQTLNDLLVVK